jgi:hypothetical protein
VISKPPLNVAICLCLIFQLLMPSTIFAADLRFTSLNLSTPPEDSTLETSEQADQARDKSRYLNSLVEPLTGFYVGLLQQYENIGRKEGAIELRRLMRSNSIQIHVPDFWEAELRDLAGVLVPKVIDLSTQETILVENLSSLPKDPEKLQKYYDAREKFIANQHISAGASRPDQQTGRDVLIMELDGGSYKSTRYPRLKMTDPKYWVEWRKDTLTRPTEPVFWLALFTASFQAANYISMPLMGLIKTGHIDRLVPTLEGTAYSFLFGLTFGILIKTIRKITRRPSNDVTAPPEEKVSWGEILRSPSEWQTRVYKSVTSPPAKRFYKSLPTSAAFYYPIQFIKNQGRSAVNIYTVSASWGGSTLFTFFSKDTWGKLNSIDDYTRDNIGHFSFVLGKPERKLSVDYLKFSLKEHVIDSALGPLTIPFLTPDIGTLNIPLGRKIIIDRQDFAMQMRGQIPVLLKFAEMTGNGPLPSIWHVYGHDFSIPIFTILSIIPARIHLWRQARITANKLMANPNTRDQGLKVDGIATKAWNDIFKIFGGDYRKIGIDGVIAKTNDFDVWQEPKDLHDTALLERLESNPQTAVPAVIIRNAISKLSCALSFKQEE